MAPEQVAIRKLTAGATSRPDTQIRDEWIVHIVSLNCTRWRVLKIQDGPDWLMADCSERDVIKLAATVEADTEEPLVVEALVESETGQRCKLPLTINLM